MKYQKILQIQLFLGLIVSLFFLSPVISQAQVSVDISAPGVRVIKGSAGANHVENASGKIDPEAEIEGVAVINEDVWIDGEKLPRTKTQHKSKKTGKTYLIKRGGSNVTVSEK